MRPIPFEELLTRIFDEYQQQRSIFGIPEQQFYSPVKVKLLASSVKPVPLPSALPLARTRSSRKILSLLADWRTFHRTKTVKFLTARSWKSPVLMPKTSALTPNGLPNLPCLKHGMNTSKHGLPCTFSKRCSNLLIPVNRSSLI